MNNCNLLLPHHSTSDWDYSSVYWTLTNAFYVSAPSSLKVWHGASGTQVTSILSRADCAQCIPEGRITGYIRAHGQITNASPTFFFRNQAALGIANHRDCYYVRFSQAVAILYRQVNNVPTVLGNSTYPGGALSDDTWYQARVTWWNDGPINLTVRIEIKRNTDWEIADPEQHDPVNQFKDSATNRCGIGTYIYSGHVNNRYSAHDNTQIFVPAT